MGRKPQRLTDSTQFSTKLQRKPENGGPESIGSSEVVTTSQVPLDPAIDRDKRDKGQDVRITTALLREACRVEAMKFMPAVSYILQNKQVSVHVKARLFETLLTFGVPNKATDTGAKAIHVQNAVIALSPRRQAIDTFPVANPSPAGDSPVAVPPSPAVPRLLTSPSGENA